MINKFSNVNMNVSNNVKLKNMVDAPKKLDSRNFVASNNYDLNKVVSSSREVESIDVDINTKVGMSKYSTTGYSDADNIHMNQFDRVMVNLQNSLSTDEYIIYCKYFEGKKISDLIDENGYLRTLEDLNKINNILKQCGISGDSKSVINKINSKVRPEDSSKWLSFRKEDGSLSLSQEMLNWEIYEIGKVKEEMKVFGYGTGFDVVGYDYTILIDSDGNPVLINSCTNKKDVSDLAAIAYVLAKQLIGEDSSRLIDNIFSCLVDSAFLESVDEIESLSEYSDYISYLKLISISEIAGDCYMGQIKANKEMILKCIEIAKKNGTKVKLNGFSLGGGLQLSAYSSLCVENPDLEEYIYGISVFNPFVSIVEQYDDVGEKYNYAFPDKEVDNKLINYIAESEKVTIYSCEEDFVSIFNNSVGKLKDHYVFVETKDISGEATGFDLFNLVIGKDSNHNIGHIINSNFDENGNLTNVGKFVSIKKTMDTLDETVNFGEGINDAIKKLVESGVDVVNLKGNFIEAVANSVGTFGEVLLKNKVDIPKIDISEIDLSKVDLSKIDYYSLFETYKPDYSAIMSNVLGFDKITYSDDSVGNIKRELVAYLVENVGNYNYSTFSYKVADVLWEAICDNINSKSGIKKTFANTFKSEDAFCDAIYEFLNEDENKELVFSLFYYMEAKEKASYDRVVEELMANLSVKYKENIKSQSKDPVLILYLLDNFVNNEISEEFISVFKDTLKGLYSN